MKKMFVFFLSILVLSISGVSYALTLTDGNSSVLIDPGSQAGANNWTVDGTNQLFQQWFWYRVGSTGPEAPINTISAPTVVTPTARIADISYTSQNNLSVDVTYVLTGGTPGSLTSDVSEVIRINNLGSSSLDFHFFQYTDFDLGGDPQGDTARLVNANTIQQFDPNAISSETVVTPAANRYEVNFFANTLNSLNDGSPTTLNNNGGPLTGDTTWAFEWDVTIPAGGSFIISKDKNIRPVPEPLSLILLGCGMVGLIELRRRIKK